MIVSLSVPVVAQIATVKTAPMSMAMKRERWLLMPFSIVTLMHLSQRFSRKRDFTRRDVTVRSQGARRSTVNATRVGLYALICVFVRDARTVMKLL